MVMQLLWGHLGETVIKTYRNQLNRKSFKTVDDYAKNFFDFIDKKMSLFTEQNEELFVRTYVYNCFRFILNEIDKTLEEIVELEGKSQKTVVKRVISQTIKTHFDRWKNSDSKAPPDYNDNLNDKYGSLIQEVKEYVFADISDESSNQLTEIALSLFTKYPKEMIAPYTSGIVFAGFGTEDIFPVLSSFFIDGKVCGFLKYKKNKEKSTRIDFENEATIIPFAQGEMVDAFMTGVDPAYMIVIKQGLQAIFDSCPKLIADSLNIHNKQKEDKLRSDLESGFEKMFDEFMNTLSELQNNLYIHPIINVVEMLPKDELAIMAETLVSLTSFKKRVSMEEETVGGPIDVAVISKGDGFIWIKRKHYFDRELNQQFFANYYEEVE